MRLKLEDIPADSKNAGRQALAIYRDAMKRDRVRIKHTMIEEVEKIYDNYLKLLLLLVELG